MLAENLAFSTYLQSLCIIYIQEEYFEYIKSWKSIDLLINAR